MKRHLLFYACLLAAVTATAASRTATEAYVTNRVTQATNALHEAIAPTIDYSTSNTTLVETIAAKAPAPDFTTNNTALVETIKETAPAPGDYANVSNAAMNAVQQGSQNWLDAESKMGAITASGDEFFPWSFMGSAYFADELVWPGDGYNYHLVYAESAMRWITWYAPPGSEDMIDEETGRYSTQEDIAYLSDIPAQQDLSGYATHEDATNAAIAVVSQYSPTPSAPETTAALRWRADGTACVVSIASGGTLTASTNNWTEGQAVMAIITLADGAGVASNIELVGYGAWPTGTAFVACCYRVGLKVFVVPSTTL